MGYALKDLDEKMLKYLTFDDGFFIEAGANDGISQNNTLLLEQRLKNWKGLLIEPSPVKFEQCKANRPNCIVENYALVSDAYEKDTILGDFNYPDYNRSLCAQVIDIHDYFDNDLKGAMEGKLEYHEIISTPAITLNKLLEKHNITHIDFFSLDVEGYEIEVLNGLDFSKYRPTYFLIETTDLKHRYDLVHNFMAEKGYKCIDAISDMDSLFTI